jgi:Flp pilus assembly pilin Flp
MKNAIRNKNAFGKNVLGIKSALRKRRDAGISSVEYIIILVFIAITGVALFQKFGTSIKTKMTTANSTFDSVNAQ